LGDGIETVGTYIIFSPILLLCAVSECGFPLN
jgi:hypothetical protein